VNGCKGDAIWSLIRAGSVLFEAFNFRRSPLENPHDFGHCETFVNKPCSNYALMTLRLKRETGV
jgi:hypothetical protein